MSLRSFFAHRSRKRAIALYEEASACVARGEYREAIAIAKKLRKLRYSGAYEIEGLAYAAQEQHEDAARVLREGVSEAPGVWVNWLLLGSSLSNLERHDEARAAYDRAAACEKADLDLIELNRAVIAARRKDHEETLRHLDAIRSHDSEGARIKSVSLRVSALHALGRMEEAEELGALTLRDWRDEGERSVSRDVAEIAWVVITIRKNRGDDPNVLRLQLIDHWNATRSDRLLELIRELRPERSPSAQYFKIILRGRISPESGLPQRLKGFWQVIEAVADTPEEALAFYVELNPPGPGITLEVDEANAIDPAPDDLEGIWSAEAGRIYYEKESR